MSAPEVFVTNFNPRFTGVSATAAGVVAEQVKHLPLALVGVALPGCPAPLTPRAAARASRRPPPGRDFAIWHVRRNSEMQRALWLRDVLRLPIRIVFTSAKKTPLSAWSRWLVSRADAVIATSQAAARHAPNVWAVVPHGVNTDRWHPAPDRAAAWAATGHPGARGIANLGRIRPSKGTDLFVEAMIRLLPQHPDVTALVVGRNRPQHRKFMERIEARVAEAGLADRILFPGEAGPEETPGLMRGLTLLMALPREEPYGMTPLEGLASGTPFVASDTGYYRQFSDEGRAGRVVPVGDVEAAVAEAEALLTDPDRHARMAAHAREVALTRFAVAREAEAAIAVYERLWAGERRA